MPKWKAKGATVAYSAVSIDVQTMLDHLGHFNMQQIRKLYQVYSGLAFADLDRTSAMQSELHTIIRKQLTHFEARYRPHVLILWLLTPPLSYLLRYRHIGVIGSVMIIHQIAKKSDMCEITDGNSQDSTKSRRQKMVSCAPIEHAPFMPPPPRP